MASRTLVLKVRDAGFGTRAIRRIRDRVFAFAAEAYRLACNLLNLGWDGRMAVPPLEVGFAEVHPIDPGQ